MPPDIQQFDDIPHPSVNENYIKTKQYNGTDVLTQNFGERKKNKETVNDSIKPNAREKICKTRLTKYLP